MNKEEFIYLITTYQKAWDNLDNLHSYCIDLYDMPIVDICGWLFDKYLDVYFTTEGVDTIIWWLFEVDDKSDCMWDKDGNVIPMETIDDLWNFLQDYLK